MEQSRNKLLENKAMNLETKWNGKKEKKESENE